MQPSAAPPAPKDNPARLKTQADDTQFIKEAAKLLNWKMSILEAMKTFDLAKQLTDLEAEMEKLGAEELNFKNANRGYIAGAGDDCSVVKAKLADLFLEVPPMNAGGKASTVPEKEAWLRQQRTANKELAGMIQKQFQVLAGVEEFRLKTETTKRKIDQTLAVIRLKTAQIELLGRSV